MKLSSHASKAKYVIEMNCRDLILKLWLPTNNLQSSLKQSKVNRTQLTRSWF